MRYYIKNNKKTFAFITAFTLIVIFFISGNEVKKGVYKSIMSCMQNIIPTLFPCLVLTTFMSQIGFPNKIKKVLSVITNIFTGLPGNCAEIIIFGLTSGYPTGVKIAKLYADNGITDIKSAKRAAALCINPGIVYTVLTVGKLQANSTKTGIIMYLCVVSAEIILAFITKKNYTNSAYEQREKKNEKTVSEIFCTAVAGAANACISLTAWVALFGGFSEIIKRLYLRKLQVIFDLTFEVTDAVSKSLYENSPEKCTFSLGFGGLCVMFQLLPDLNKLQISAAEYLASRLFVGLLSSAFIKIVRIFLPVSFLPVFSQNKQIVLSNNAVPGFLSVVFLCVIFMYGIANRLALC